MFERLSQSLGTAFRNLSGRGRLSEANVREAMAEVRTALLEADVNLEVVDRFCEDCVQDALGKEVTKGRRWWAWSTAGSWSSWGRSTAT
jgi:signal recognition particle subunit SRP54